MNWIDILLILIFFGTLATGFFQGAIRLLVLMLAFYLALVLASLYYPALGEFFVRNFDTQRFIGQYLAFFLVLFLSFALLAIAGLYTFRYLRLTGSLEYLDRIVGTILGLLFGALIVGVVAALLWNLMILRGGRNIDLPLLRLLGNGVANSFVLQYFSTIVLPLVYNFLDPILPEGADIIFAVQ
ncbi:MAG: CvpA family protein [Chloroflexaceae bacterium]